MRSKRIVLVLAAIGLLVGAISIPRWEAAAYLNSALIMRLKEAKNESVMARLTQAFTLNPDNRRVRWYWGSMLFYGGDSAGAATVLFPLAYQPPDSRTLGLLFSALSDAGRQETLLSLYDSFTKPPSLPWNVAAKLMLQLARNPESRHLPPLLTLLPPALGLAPGSPEFQLIKARLDSPEFWSTDLGQRTYRALVWRDQASRAKTPPSSTQVADLLQVAGMLGAAPESLKYGDELVVNGDFEKPGLERTDIPEGWAVSFMTSGNPWNRAAFVVGLDSSEEFMGSSALRIDGLLVEHVPELEGARAGVTHQIPIPMKPETPYVISFVYRTEMTDDSIATLWLSYESQVAYAGDKFFPATHGQWMRVVILAWNRTGQDANIAPLLRSFGEGSVWFDSFSIRPVLTYQAVPAQETLIQITEATNGH